MKILSVRVVLDLNLYLAFHNVNGISLGYVLNLGFNVSVRCVCGFSLYRFFFLVDEKKRIGGKS